MPVVDGRLNESAWDSALRSGGDLVLIGEAGVESSHPFALRVAGDASTLYVGVEIGEISLNPGSEPDSWRGEWVRLLLAPDVPSLASPADAIFAAGFQPGLVQWTDGFWNGHAWEGQIGFDHPEGTWTPSTRPAGTRWVATHVEGNTFSWEFQVPRVSEYPACDGFQVRGTEPFGLRIRFERHLRPEAGGVMSTLYPPGEDADLDEWLWLRFPGPLFAEFEVHETKDCGGRVF